MVYPVDLGIRSMPLEQYTYALREEGHVKRAGMLSYLANYSDKKSESLTFGDILVVLEEGRVPLSEMISMVRDGLVMSNMEFEAIKRGYSGKSPCEGYNSDVRKLKTLCDESMNEIEEKMSHSSSMVVERQTNELKDAGKIGYPFDPDTMEEFDAEVIKYCEVESYLNSLMRETGDEGTIWLFEYLKNCYAESNHEKTTVGEVLHPLESGKLEPDEVSAIIETGTGMRNQLLLDAIRSGYRMNEKIIEQLENKINEIDTES